MREIRQLQHQYIAGGFALGRLLVERGNLVAQVFGLGLFGFRLGDFLLPHQRADFLAHPVAEGFERLHFGQQLAALLVKFEQFVNFGFIAGPAAGQTGANEIGFLAD